MKEVTINQCDFCKKTTCLCNSIEHGISPFMCLLGVKSKLNNGKYELKTKSKFINGKNELKTNCPDWLHFDLKDNIDHSDFTTGVPDQASLVLSIIAHITLSPVQFIEVKC